MVKAGSRRESASVMGCETDSTWGVGGRPRAKECGRSLEAGKGKGRTLPQSPQKACSPADTSVLAWGGL